VQFGLGPDSLLNNFDLALPRYKLILHRRLLHLQLLLLCAVEVNTDMPASINDVRLGLLLMGGTMLNLVSLLLESFNRLLFFCDFAF